MATNTINGNLLKAVRGRQKRAEHNYGIMTGDRYARTLLDCVGSELCYRYATRRDKSFDDALKRASNTLTYNNEDMVLEENLSVPRSLNINGKTVEIPKNTLLVVRHVVTTPRKDRDGDILRTRGAKPDPSMLLLWQHTHTLPIGKALGVAEHTEKKLSFYTAVVDVNALAHDAVVMIEAKMGRYSHGFRALEFSENKAEPGKTTAPGGFDVKSFEIMEISLVSVPSNVDAETEEIILDMAEGGKFKSEMMRGVGKGIRLRRTKAQSGYTGKPVLVDLATLKQLVGTKSPEEDDEDEDDFDDGLDLEGKPEAKGKCGCGKPTSKEADDGDDEEGGDKGAEDDKGLNKEVSQANADAYNDMGPVLCPACGIAAGEDGKCPQCGKPAKKTAYLAWDKAAGKWMPVEMEKAGRVLSGKNFKMLEEVANDLKTIQDGCGMWSAKQLCTATQGKVKTVLASALPAETAAAGLTVKAAAAHILAHATVEERANLKTVLEIMVDTDKSEARLETLRHIME